MRARGPYEFIMPDCLRFITFITQGTMKANVLPDPVFEMLIRSQPLEAIGMAIKEVSTNRNLQYFWMLVGVVQPSAAAVCFTNWGREGSWKFWRGGIYSQRCQDWISTSSSTGAGLAGPSAMRSITPAYEAFLPPIYWSVLLETLASLSWSLLASMFCTDFPFVFWELYY